MPVHKFESNGDRTTTVYTGINMANLTNIFARRDGGNTAIGDIDRNIIKTVLDPSSNQDVATKNYGHINAFTAAGGVVPGDIKLNVGSDLVRSLGCNDLITGKKVYTSAGDRHKYANVFHAQFRTTSAYQNIN